jgi:hypothetical protein
MTANSLIDLTLGKIARGYHSGTLVWMKTNRANDWGNMLTLERRINKAALDPNLKALREALSEYQGLILTMAREFVSPRGKKEQEIFKFGNFQEG